MALELLEGGSLHQIRSKLGVRALPIHLGARVLVAVLDALDLAHDLTDEEGRSLAVVHRDVSPQNVFLTFDGDVKLIDFGVAKSRDRRGAAVTRVGVVKGSVPYMSPDHVDGSSIDRRADVFAVGVILREMLVGERLWGDADDMTILRALIRRQLPAFPEVAGDAAVPSVLRAIAERAMAPRRGDRFPSAAAMRDELIAYLADADPRGSFDDVGAWLGHALSAERAAFHDLVRKSRAASRAKPARPAPGARPAVPAGQIWLPSCDLATRYSGPPALPSAPPALPAAAVALPSRGTRIRSRIRSLGAGVVFAAALGLAALGLSQPRHGSFADRAPRAVDDTVTVSIVTKPVTATAEDPSAPVDEPDREALQASALPVARDVHELPAAVLREPLPPNPYDTAE
jgi:serine/threonine-protein kinase